MGLNLGFVSICLSEKDCSPASTVTLKSVAELPYESVRSRIERTALRNLIKTLRIMYFLRAHDLQIYRFSSQLIPLASHPITDGWAWWEEPALLKELRKIGSTAKQAGIRLSMHAPSQVVLNAADPNTFVWTKRYLDYLEHLFRAMGLGKDTKVVFHVGGLYEGRAAAFDYLRRNVAELSLAQRARIILENDDTTFSLADVLEIADEVGFPVVPDVHHHLCVPSKEPLRELIGRAVETWTDRPPKFHVSSPRSNRDLRAHADYVDVEAVTPLLEWADRPGGIDVMVEAKKKDLAALRLREELAGKVLQPVGKKL